MYLYYQLPEGENGKPNVYVDFHSIKERVEIPETSLYRLLTHTCKSYRYRNRSLYAYEDVMKVLVIAKEMKLNPVSNEF